MADIMARSNDRGRPFAAVIVRDGDQYGRDFCLTHKGKPMVEFWDLMHPHAPVAPGAEMAGQFVSRYFVDTLLARDDFPHHNLAVTGLCLDGGFPDVWSIDAGTMGDYLDWLEELFPLEAATA